MRLPTHIRLSANEYLLDQLVPEWRELVQGAPAAFVDRWCVASLQSERNGWRWLARAREILADEQLAESA